jgi:hypothetical protein
MNLGIPYIHVAVAIHCDYFDYVTLNRLSALRLA